MEYYWELVHVWLTDVLKSIVAGIKSKPIEIIANIIMYSVAFCLFYVVIKFIFTYVLMRNIYIRRYLRRYSGVFRIFSIKIDHPIQTVLNIVQSISLIIAIIFSDNITNMIQLSEVKGRLEKYKSELGDVKSNLFKVEDELSEKRKSLEELSKENTALSNKSNKLLKQINELKNDIAISKIEGCFADIISKIQKYVVDEYTKMSLDVIKKKGNIKMNETVEMMKKSFQITQETLVKRILESLFSQTFDEETRKIYAVIFNMVSGNPNLQSYVCDVDAYIKERSDIFRKKTFIFFNDKNFAELIDIEQKLSRKYMIPNINNVVNFIKSIESEMIASRWLSSF